MPSRTLLGHTLSRIESVLDVIDTVERTDFPYKDSFDALCVIKKEFFEIRDTLRAQPTESSLTVVGTACSRALELVFNYLPLIGFIARSSSTDSAPELHGPLQRLTASIIGPTARLVLSSEWEYSPYTTFYPPLTTLQFVVVGLPRSESANALAVPIAGHELGHNIWSQLDLTSEFTDSALASIRRAVTANWKDFGDVMGLPDPSHLDDLLGQGALARPYQACMAQAEEIFCDCVGLYLFGESFLLAFQYLLSPGIDRQVSLDGYCDYPRIKDRVSILEGLAKSAGIRVPDAFVETFVLDESEQSWSHMFADTPALALVASLAQKARDVLAYGTKVRHNEEEVERHARRFRKSFPVSGASSIAHLINAAWRVYQQIDTTQAHSESDHQKSAAEKTLINELLLKSIEVFEIEQRQK